MDTDARPVSWADNALKRIRHQRHESLAKTLDQLLSPHADSENTVIFRTEHGDYTALDVLCDEEEGVVVLLLEGGK